AQTDRSSLHSLPEGGPKRRERPADGALHHHRAEPGWSTNRERQQCLPFRPPLSRRRAARALDDTLHHQKVEMRGCLTAGPRARGAPSKKAVPSGLSQGPVGRPPGVTAPPRRSLLPGRAYMPIEEAPSNGSILRIVLRWLSARRRLLGLGLLRRCLLGHFLLH